MAVQKKMTRQTAKNVVPKRRIVVADRLVVKFLVEMESMEAAPEDEAKLFWAGLNSLSLFFLPTSRKDHWPYWLSVE